MISFCNVALGHYNCEFLRPMDRLMSFPGHRWHQWFLGCWFSFVVWDHWLVQQRFRWIVAIVPQPPSVCSISHFFFFPETWFVFFYFLSFYPKPGCSQVWKRTFVTCWLRPAVDIFWIKGSCWARNPFKMRHFSFVNLKKWNSREPKSFINCVLNT